MSTMRTPQSQPIVLAPMAGGPSTPELVAAVSNAGGFGFLAAGYLTPAALAEQARATESLLADGCTFGINLFCAESVGDNATEAELLRWAEFRDSLESLAAQLGVELPDTPTWSDDYFTEKLDSVLSEDFLSDPTRLEYISFTFGYPSADIIQRVKDSGRKVILNATSIAGVQAASAAGADQIVLQGLGAGGHRGFVAGMDSSDDIAPTIDGLAEAIAEASAVTEVPLIAAGGIGDAEDVGKLLAAGATAVQVGTRFLTATEAGTKPTHRAALLELKDRDTMLTRAFSGKLARTIRNEFAQEFSQAAPALYPQLHYLTAPIKGASNKSGNPEYLNLWAGTGFTQCRDESAAEVIADLMQSI